MKVNYQCDGCDKQFDDLAKMSKVGSINPCVYCDVCAEEVKTYLEELERARIEIAELWQEKIKRLRMAFIKRCRDLPDA